MKKVKLFKKTMVTVMAAVLVLSLTACREKKNDDNVNAGDESKKQETQETQETQTPKEKSVLTIAIESTGDIPEKFQSQIDRFNEQSETAEFKILTYAGSEAYETAIMGQIAGQTAPDIIWLDGGKKIQEYSENGVIVPLDSYFEDIIDNFEESLVEAFMYNGNLYGITKDYNTSVLFYHDDLLKENNQGIPQTITEFISAAEALTTDDYIGFGCDPKINYLYPFAATMGADFINEDGSIDLEKLVSKEHEQMLSMFKTMYKNKQATSPYLESAGWDGELFGNKKVAMLYAGSWVTGVIEDPKLAGVAALPVQDQNASMLFTAGWSITSQCKDVQSAVDLIRFMSTDEELVKGNMDGLIGLPPTKSAMDLLIKEKKDDPFLPVYREVVKDGTAFGLLDTRFVDSYNKAFENMIYNNASVEDTIKAMEQGIK